MFNENAKEATAEEAMIANKFAKLTTIAEEAEKQTDYVVDSRTWELHPKIFEVLAKDYKDTFLNECMNLECMAEKITINQYDLKRYFKIKNQEEAFKKFDINYQEDGIEITLSGNQLIEFIEEYINWEEVLIDFSFKNEIEQIKIGENHEIGIFIYNVEELLHQILREETKNIPSKHFFYKFKERFLEDKTPTGVHYLPNSKHLLYYYYKVDGYSFHAPIEDIEVFDEHWENETYTEINDMQEMHISAKKYKEIVKKFTETYEISDKGMNLINTLYQIRQEYFNN